jgi:hypothetical protein
MALAAAIPDPLERTAAELRAYGAIPFEWGSDLYFSSLDGCLAIWDPRKRSTWALRPVLAKWKDDADVLRGAARLIVSSVPDLEEDENPWQLSPADFTRVAEAALAVPWVRYAYHLDEIALARKNKFAAPARAILQKIIDGKLEPGAPTGREVKFYAAFIKDPEGNDLADTKVREMLDLIKAARVERAKAALSGKRYEGDADAEW